jgi:hypothetical protein
LFSPKSHSQPLTDKELKELAAQLAWKQQQQEQKSLFYTL